MLPAFFDRLPRGLRLVMIGVVLWLVATVPLALYLLLARLFGEPPAGPGVSAAMGFALNVVAVILLVGGLFTWLRDDIRARRNRPTVGTGPRDPPASASKRESCP